MNEPVLFVVDDEQGSSFGLVPSPLSRCAARLCCGPARLTGVRSGFAVILLATLSVAACGTSGSASTPAATHSAAVRSPAAAASTSTGTCHHGAWRSAPVSAAGPVTLPGVPVLTAVRAAAHPECGYDRLVLDISGPLPRYAIRYVSQVRADPSDRLISLPGRRFLVITLHPAQMHTSAGIATITGVVRVLDYPVLAGWAPAGDFEGYVTLAVGLNAETRVRAGELDGRIYVDFRE